MNVLHSSSAKLFSIIAILSLLVVSSAAVMAQDRSTPMPAWTKGQTWAVGGEMDLANVAGANLGTMQDTLTLFNISIDQLQMTGTAAAWMVFKVTDVRQDTYLLEYSAGLCIHGGLDANLTGDLPIEGTYNLFNMTKEKRGIGADACLDQVLTSHGVATIDKATMAIVGVVSTSVLDQRMTFNAHNFPDYSTSISIRGITVNMTYQNYSVAECLHLELASNISFAPALNLLQFPLTVGNNWTIDSKMTFEGTARGNFNATGLPSSMLSGLIQKSGAFNGSVPVQDLTKLGTMQLDNGTFGPVEQNIKATMECVGTTSVGDGPGHNITVFDVKERQSGAHLFYSPDNEFLASALVNPQLDLLNGLVTLPGGSMTNKLKLNTGISMASADPIAATDEISKIGASQGVQPVSLLTPTDTGSAVPGQDPTMMIFFVAAIVVIGAGVGAVLLLRKRAPKGL